MKAKDLSKQITATYRMLRLGLAVIAFAFPPLLWLGGHFRADLPLAGSMSAYYHASDPLHPEQGPPGKGVMRNEFVGILFVVGALLFTYQGYHRLEDYALNLAGFMALGIAIFPMRWSTEPDASSFSLHGICAISFFACIAYVCIWRAADTLCLIGDIPTRRRYLRTYQLLGCAMVICPFLAWVLISRLPLHKSAIFFVELAGIYVFATYWAIKIHEASKTNVDRDPTVVKPRVKLHGLSDVLHPLPATSVDEPKQGSSDHQPAKSLHNVLKHDT